MYDCLWFRWLLAINEFTLNGRHFSITEGDKEVISQTFFCYKDESKGVIPGILFSNYK